MAGAIWIADRGCRRSRPGSRRRWFQQPRGMAGSHQPNRSQFAPPILYEIETQIGGGGAVPPRFLLVGRGHLRDQHDRPETADPISESWRLDQRDAIQDREIPQEI